jgi:xylulokinase
VRSLRQLLAEAGGDAQEIAAVGLTSQMHGLALLDGARKALRPAILWSDQRTAMHRLSQQQP